MSMLANHGCQILRLNSPARFRRAVLAMITVLLALGAADGSAAAADYLLGPQDKIRLKVYEWRPSRDDAFEWKALNDTFTVGPDGTIALPFAGTVKASGLTPEKLGSDIGLQLMRRMGFGAPPDASVEIIQFRPFYITGYVTQPGEFPYRPGLTVLQALAIAGGLRTKEDSTTRLEREIIAGQGDVGVLNLNALSLLARKARLEAELAGKNQIEFPAQLAVRKDDSTIRMLEAQEQSIFKARRDGLATQVKAFESLRESLKDELGSLQGQLVFHDKQIDLIEKELTSVTTLVNKGFAAAPREMSLERELAQFQSTRLAAETSLLRSRQEISRADISILDLRDRYTNEVTVAIRDTQAQLDEIGNKTNTAVQLLRELAMFAPRLLSMRAQANSVKPIYTIIRRGQDGDTRITANEDMLIEPGDTVKVDMPPIPSADDLELSTSGALTGSALLPFPGQAPINAMVLQ